MRRADFVRIRRPELADAEPLAHLHLDVWEDAYTGLVPQRILEERRAKWTDRIAMWEDILGVREVAVEAAATWIAEEDSGRLMGFVSVGPARDADMGQDAQRSELYALYVRAAYWDTGIGHALLQTAIGDRDAYLWVLAANARAVLFYERQGFTRDGAVQEADEGQHVRMVRGFGHRRSPSQTSA